MNFGQWNTFTSWEETIESPLKKACRLGQYNKIKSLLKKSNIHPISTLEDTPLHWAAESHNPEVIGLLLNKGAPINHQNFSGATPLHQACSFGRVENVKLLLEMGANPNIPDFSRERTPLLIACDSHNPELVNILLQYGADVNFKSDKILKGYTPLNAVCQTGDLQIAKILLQHGADPLQEDFNSYESTPLQDSIICGNCELVSMMLKLGANVNYLPCGSDDEVVRQIETPLTLACKNGLTDIALLLLHGGADVNLKNIPNLETPLHVARDPTLITLLLDSGSDINARDKCGATPCHTSRTSEIMAILLNRGADPTIRDDMGETILHCVCELGYEEILYLLLDRKMNSNIKNKDGDTPLHLAVCAGQLVIVNILLLRGKANLEAKNKKGYTPLFLACMADNIDMIKLLLDHGANVNVKNKATSHLCSALLALKKRWDAARILLDNGLNLKVDHLACYVKSVPPKLWKNMMYHRVKKPWLCFTTAIHDASIENIHPLSQSHKILGISDLCRYICEFL